MYLHTVYSNINWGSRAEKKSLSGKLIGSAGFRNSSAVQRIKKRRGLWRLIWGQGKANKTNKTKQNHKADIQSWLWDSNLWFMTSDSRIIASEVSGRTTVTEEADYSITIILGGSIVRRH